MKTKVKIYLALGLFFLLLISTLIVLMLFKIITMLSFMIFMLIIIVMPAMVIMLVYFIRKAKLKGIEEKDLFKRKRELDSDTVIQWTKDYMRRNYVTEIELKNKQTFQFGDVNERTTILHLNVFGTTDHKYYDVLVNAFDKNLHSIIPGFNDYVYIEKLAEHLAFAPVYRPKRIIKRIQPEGISTTVEEELPMPQVKEEITEHEETKKDNK